MFATYDQPTGTLATDFPRRVFVGYSGHGLGKNNPALQSLPRVGPVPQGTYAVSNPFTHPEKGRLCFRLVPMSGNHMFGRSGFLIHGDSIRHPGDASEGCIILPLAAREYLAFHKLSVLQVGGPVQRSKAA
jgi:hypothetical protein